MKRVEADGGGGAWRPDADLEQSWRLERTPHRAQPPPPLPRCDAFHEGTAALRNRRTSRI